MVPLEQQIRLLNMAFGFSELDAKTRNALPDEDFAYIDDKGNRHLPIHDANHARTALARLNQVEDMPEGAKDRAIAKIKRRYPSIDVSAKTAQERKVQFDGGDADDDDDDDDIVGDDDDDDDDDDDSKRKKADDAAPGGIGPGVGDVHAIGIIGQQQGKKKKSPALKRFMQGLRNHFSANPTITAEQLEREYRRAIGGAGGASRNFNGQPEGGCDGDCCENCMGPGCGCCEMCEPDMASVGGPNQYNEGSAHLVASDGQGYRLVLPQVGIRAAEVGNWINYLPKPGTYTNPRYGTIDISTERNADFVKKFAKGVYQDKIPVDIEHESKLSGAMGWIDQLKQNSDGSVDAHVSWTKRGIQMTQDDAFRYFSPEWYDDWKDPATGEVIDNVAIGGALTTRPFFKPRYLRPLVASENGMLLSEDGDSIQPKEKTSMSGTTSDATQAAEDKIAELQTQLRQATEALDAAKGASEAKDEALRQATEMAQTAVKAVEAIKAENRRREFREVAKGFLGDVEKNVSLMEKLNDEDRELFVTTMRSAAELASVPSAFAPLGVHGRGMIEDGITERVRRFSEDIAKRDNISVQAAEAKVWSEHPELYDEYDKDYRKLMAQG